MSKLKIVGKILSAVIKVVGKRLKYFFKLFYILRKKKIYIPIHFIIGVVPQIMGAYRYLSLQGLKWYYAFFGAVGAETGGAFITVSRTTIKIFSGGNTNLDVLFLFIGVLSSLFTIILIIDLWSLIMRGFAKNIGFFPIIITLSVIMAATFTNTLFIDEYVLDDGEDRVSGMTYFLEDPNKSLSPFNRIRENSSDLKNNETDDESYNLTGNKSLTDQLLSSNTT